MNKSTNSNSNGNELTFILMLVGTLFAITTALFVYYFLEVTAELSVLTFFAVEIIIPIIGYQIVKARTRSPKTR